MRPYLLLQAGTPRDNRQQSRSTPRGKSVGELMAWAGSILADKIDIIYRCRVREVLTLTDDNWGGDLTVRGRETFKKNVLYI